MIKTKRVYEPPDDHDGKRVLVERLWPRGMRKEALQLDEWNKDVAPSPELRKWFSHDPEKWEEFCRRYDAELDENHEAWKPLQKAADQGNLTLLYSAHDQEHNSAILLKEYLDKKNSR